MCENSIVRTNKVIKVRVGGRQDKRIMGGKYDQSALYAQMEISQ
jgi:hypothetical protein